MERAIHVGTAGGLFLAGADRPSELEGREVNALARGGDGWWAIVDGREVWRKQAEAWERVATSPDRRLNCLLPIDGSCLIGTSEAHLLRLDGGEPRLIEAFDRAETREAWYTPWGGPPDVRSLSAAPSGTLFANVHVGGIMRSADAGVSWSPTIDLHADVHEVRAVDDGLVLAATARGLGLSRDGGRSWEIVRDGLHATYARAVGACADAILLTASLGPSGGRAAVYRREAGGEFEKCEAGLPDWFPKNLDTGCLATAGSRAALGTDDGEVFLSQDSGRTWQQVASGLPAARQLAFA